MFRFYSDGATNHVVRMQTCQKAVSLCASSQEEFHKWFVYFAYETARTVYACYILPPLRARCIYLGATFQT